MTITNKHKNKVFTTRHLLVAVCVGGASMLTGHAMADDHKSSAGDKQKNARQAADRSAAERMNDLAIQGSIQSEFLTEKVSWFNQIDVSVKEGRATLSGEVASLRDKEMAETLASNTRGVTWVENNIRVTPNEKISESALVDRVKRALLINTATESFEIDVEADDEGTVTLSGEVESYAERHLARDVASTIQGVTKIVNQIDVDYVTDRLASQIRLDIVNSLRFDALVDASNIDVSVDNNTVTLSGTVGSLTERRRAMNAAYVNGVRLVKHSDLKVDPLQLRYGEAARLTSDEITDAIDRSMLLSPSVNSTDVTTYVNDGRVQLTGTVPSLKAKRTAERLAHETSGVRSVSNFIRVTPGDQTDDTQIKRQITTALVNDSVVESYQIDARVEDGTVTLSGTVDSLSEKWTAGDVVSSIRGVKQVKNNIGVMDTSVLYYSPYVYPTLLPSENGLTAFSTTPAADDEIEQDIEDQLYWSPFVDSDDVSVEVTSGVATLTGTAEDYSERRDATKNAFDGGAIAVDNDLVIVNP